MKTFKKTLASVGLVSMLAMNVAMAAQIGTGTITGGTTTSINSTWDGTSNPAGVVASGSLNVQVSAQVVPTLNMTISTGSINFGPLTPGIEATGGLTITTATNAEQGVTVAMASNGLESTTKYIGNYGAIALSGATMDTSDYYKASSTTTGHTVNGIALSLNDIAASQNVLSASNVFQSNATTDVVVSAMAGSMTEAGNYADTLTFTVTGNF